jgi:outer membrane protein OmpA-like peptidoglycan-associated protein
MSEAADDNQNLVLGIVFALIAAIVAGVITLATSRLFADRPMAPAAPPATAVAPMAPAVVEAPAPIGPALDKLYFEVGSAALPADAGAVLTKVADDARAGTQLVLISGFHDASGDPAANAELAKNRALAVRHALEANGVSPDRLVMSKPAVTTGGDDAREARRVELRLQ